MHGFPQNGKVTDPGYQPYVTRDMVQHAHDNGIKVIPWTVDDPATMHKLIDDGVDGIITDYPDRLRQVMRERASALPKAYASPFDIQGHRGARAVRPENTLAAFRYALANPDVSTLELDTGVTADGQLVVIHDRTINGSHCVDTAPATPGDPEFPYVGKRVHDLTLAQIKTLDCGSKTLPEFPNQLAVPGERIPTLAEVFDAVRASGREDVRLNIETKISPLVDDTAPYRVFTRTARQGDHGQRGSPTARRSSPSTGAPSCWPGSWTGASRPWRWSGSTAPPSARASPTSARCRPCTAIHRLRARGPAAWTGGRPVTLADWYRRRTRPPSRPTGRCTTLNRARSSPRTGTSSRTRAYFHGPRVQTLQERHHLKVVPYTVNDEATMQHVIDLGVDGIISDDPDLLVLVARRNGLR